MVYLVKGSRKGRLWCGHRGKSYVAVKRGKELVSLCLRCAYVEKVRVDREVSEEEWMRINFGENERVW